MGRAWPRRPPGGHAPAARLARAVAGTRRASIPDATFIDQFTETNMRIGIGLGTLILIILIIVFLF
jgi:hypothetical protein